MLFQFLYHLFSKLFFFTGAFQDKNSFPKPLSAEEEDKYLALASQGNQEAKDILIKHNMRLVAHVAKKYAGAAEQDDLISVGSIGLIKAINNFQRGHGTTLAGYSARCIENEILMLIRANKKHKATLSLSDPVGVDKEGNELTLMDLLFEKEDCVFDKVERGMLQEKFISRIRECLTEREFVVISLRYGLKTGVPLAQREVACLMHISRSYISRIEKKGLEKLQKQLKREDFLD